MEKFPKISMNSSKNLPWPKPHISPCWRAALCQLQSKASSSITSGEDSLSLSSQPCLVVSLHAYITWNLEQKRQPRSVQSQSTGRNLHKRIDFTTMRHISGVADYRTLEYYILKNFFSILYKWKHIKQFNKFLFICLI